MKTGKVIDAVFEEVIEKPASKITVKNKNDKITFHDIALFVFGIGLIVFSRCLFTYLTFRR